MSKAVVISVENLSNMEFEEFIQKYIDSYFNLGSYKKITKNDISTCCSILFRTV